MATVTNGIPVIGGQDFADRSPTEQNFLRAVFRRLRTIDTIASLDLVTTADATDLPTAIALGNANKAKINEIIAALSERTVT